MGIGVNLFLIFDSVLFNSTGLLFVVLGVFTLIRMAGFPDLTVDGSFTIGAALYSVSLVNGFSTPTALLLAAVGGALGGLLTWTVNEHLGVGKVVSSVLSMIILILSTPYLSGGSTKSLLNVRSIHSTIEGLDATLTTALIGSRSYQAHLIFSSLWLTSFFALGTLTLLALNTRAGLRMRYAGSAASPTLVPKREQTMLLLGGLMAGNAIVALGGAVEAQRRGGYTNNMGIGMLLVGLAVLVLGEALIKSVRKRDHLRLSEYALAILVGSIVYCTGIQLLLAVRIDFVDLRLLTALFLLLLLGIAGRAYSSSTKLF
jgi:putative ABC transport system permease protein